MTEKNRVKFVLTCPALHGSHHPHPECLVVEEGSEQLPPETSSPSGPSRDGPETVYKCVYTHNNTLIDFELINGEIEKK